MNIVQRLSSKRVSQIDIRVLYMLYTKMVAQDMLDDKLLIISVVCCDWQNTDTKIMFSCSLHWHAVFRYANEGFLQIERSYCVAQAIIYVAVHVPANFMTTHASPQIPHCIWLSAEDQLEACPGQ